MNEPGKQQQRREAAEAEPGQAVLDEQQSEARERALLVDKLAVRVLDECRVTLMLSFRYLDIALWKLPFVAKQQNAALATDGTSLLFNPDLVILRFKASPNELIRDYLQVILHCVLRHPFETWRREPTAWSTACDLCVEAIAMEMCGRLYPCAGDEDRAEGLRILRREVEVLTPARIYRSLVDGGGAHRRGDAGSTADDELARTSGMRQQASSLKGRVWQLGEEVSFLESVERMRPLFWRDDHEPWSLLKLGDDAADWPAQRDSGNDQTEDDTAAEDGQRGSGESPQAGCGEGEEPESAEGEGGAQGGGGDNGAREGSSEENPGEEGPGEEDEEGANGSGAPDAGASETSDEGEEGSRDGDGSAADGEREAPDGDVRREGPSGADDEPAPDAADANQLAGASALPVAAESAEADDERSASESEGRGGVPAPVLGDAGQADMYGYVEKDLQDIVDTARLSEIEWSDISKRIEADLKTISSMRGYETGTLMANLALANRSRINYADFLRRFSAPVEDANISDDEFDYIYYTYGLSRYGNMPLVEPLESRETFRVRDFVIAIDTSGSTTGELERIFVTRTLELLKQSAHHGDEVNIHIVQCDSKIRKVTVISDTKQLDAFEETFEVFGMGGTDFRPVFAYVDDLRQQGHFANLQGLLYFTDGLGIFPATPPPYDTAFVFVEDEGKEMKVPPWAMRVVLDEDSIREW